MGNLKEHRIHEADAGQRFDRYLRKLLPEAPLSLLHRWLRKGEVRLDGRRVAASTRLEPGQTCRFEASEAELARLGKRPAPAAPKGLGFRIEWLHRDEDLGALRKPAGVPVQGDGTERDLAGMLGELGGRGRTFRPAPTHRLDRMATGVLMVGLSPLGLRGLTAAFREGRVRKLYLVHVLGRPEGSGRRLVAWIRERSRRDPGGAEVEVCDRKVAGAKRAELVFHVLAAAEPGALVLVELGTGRKHQIRAQFAAIGHALVGDRKYGSRFPETRASLLHCWRVECRHPSTGEDLAVEAPVPFPESFPEGFRKEVLERARSLAGAPPFPKSGPR